MDSMGQTQYGSNPVASPGRPHSEEKRRKIRDEDVWWEKRPLKNYLFGEQQIILRGDGGLLQ